MNLKLNGDQIFYTLQGEAPFIGEPAVFIRLSVCNARCTWCDTPTAVFPDQLEIFNRAAEEVAKELGALLAEKECQLLVITGGEPMLQRKQLKEMLQLLDKELVALGHGGVTVQFETNGSQRQYNALETAAIVKHSSWSEGLYRLYYVVSPKDGFEGNEDLKLEVDRGFFAKDRVGLGHVTFKMVHVNRKSCEQEVAKLLAKGVSKKQIYLMPEGWVPDSAAHQRCAATALALKVRMSPRLHTMIWGDARGV